MMTSEPVLAVGVIDGVPEVRGVLHGSFRTESGDSVTGAFTARASAEDLRLAVEPVGTLRARGELKLSPLGEARAQILNVTIGVQFHWERTEAQTFQGAVRFRRRPDATLTLINDIALEQYLTSVISSEMSAESSLEFLRAHAITSRSWLVAMLDRRDDPLAQGKAGRIESPELIVRWYDRQDHDAFDVCADDHCQRYQGLTKIVSPVAAEAVASTRGVFLVHGGRVCDARFFKACGGRTEEFQNAWEDRPLAYLRSVTDGPGELGPVSEETSARRWIESSPEAFCNTRDARLLKKILPSFDQETTDFFRWKVDYSRTELEVIIRQRSQIDFGDLLDLVPIQRGPSGRITRLKIVGRKRTVTVGKELEIRKWLSRSHLYSSAFIVGKVGPAGSPPERFVLRGAGWGHGVGLCQIGAAVMAERGYTAESIVKHYFRTAELTKLYP